MAKAINEIKAELEQASWEQRKLLLSEYGKDSRKGVQNLVIQYRKRAKALFQELERLDGMRVFEKKYSPQYLQICGIDEAGRGPLAGPVVA